MSIKTLITIFLFSCCSAASLFANKNTDYLHKIYAAEEAIISGQHKEALQIYWTAFDLKKEKIFSEDIFNALMVSFEIKQTKKSDTLLQMLAQTGVGGNFIKHHFGKFYLSDTAYFNKICESATAAKRNFEEKNKAMLSRLKALYDEDRFYHTRWMNHDRSVNTEEDSVYRAMDQSDKRLSKELKTIYDSGNTLSEFQLGAYVDEGQILGYKRDFFMIIVHNYQAFQAGVPLFNQVLLQQIKNGDIKPQFFTSLSDATSNKLKKDHGDAAGYVAFQDNQLFYNKYVYGDTEWNKELNQNRAAIHLCPLNLQLERIHFNRTFNDGRYFISTPRYSTNSEIDLDYFEAYKP